MLSLISRKVISLIVFFFITLTLALVLILPSYTVAKNKESANFSKNIIMDILPLMYQYCFNSPIYYSGEYQKSNKIDIVIANHINTIDFGIYLSLVKKFDDRNPFFVMKKDVVFIPTAGFILISSPDLKLNRKIEQDHDNITKTIKKIKSGVIIIMPEGTRFTPDKQLKAQEYSRTNNLPVFKNTLYPKMKGIWTIINILKEQGRLGHLIDFTNIVENFKGKAGYLPELLTTELGNTFSIIESYSIPQDNSLKDYGDFKKWFLEIWKKKDFILENYQNYQFKKLNIEYKISSYILVLILSIILVYLTIQTKWLYLIITLLVSYLITFIKYKMI
jgi:1-acyl-sn-glycerol-3-phosphate acyltransferase